MGLPFRRPTTSKIANGQIVRASVFHGVLKAPALQYEEVLEMMALDQDFDSQQVLLGRNFLADFVVTLDARRNRVLFNRHDSPTAGPVEDE